MYCPECGEKILDGSRFCSFCGAKVLIAPDGDSAGQEVTGETRIFSGSGLNTRGEVFGRTEAGSAGNGARPDAAAGGSVPERELFSDIGFEKEVSEVTKRRREGSQASGVENRNQQHNESGSEKEEEIRKKYEEGFSGYKEQRSGRKKSSKRQTSSRKKRNRNDLYFLFGAATITLLALFLFMIIVKGVRSSFTDVITQDSVITSASNADSRDIIDTEAAMSAAIRAAEEEESRRAAALGLAESESEEEDFSVTESAESEAESSLPAEDSSPAESAAESEASGTESSESLPSESESSAALPTETPKTPSSSDSAPADLASLKAVRFNGAAATSQLVQQDTSISNAPEKAVDSDTVTSWQEGVEGSGVGEQLTVTLGEKQKLRCLVLYLGNWREPRTYAENNRPKELILTINGASYEFAFSDAMLPHYIDFPEALETDTITFTIKSVYEGSDPGDTCISEIIPYAAD
ncbi:MAG: zinc-ribbon domain-containing protein [Lachnospiraceae bacterium]|nr:zinc-ribbon domain-containing protein [Lachnospiraceae bacterium]